jgi:hypothetical protein
MAESRVDLADASSRLLHGGQNVQLEEGEWIEVELDVRVGPRVGVALQHTLKDAREVRLDATRTLPRGSRLQLRYTFVPEPGYGRTQCLSVAKPVRDQPARLDFTLARMRVHRSGEVPPRGVTILRDEITRARQRPATNP